MINTEIIKKCQAKDEEAFYELYQAVNKKAFWTAYLLAGNKDIAEDIVQEAFLKCFMHIEKLQKPELFPVWFHRILVRTCWSVLSKKKKIITESLEERNEELADDTNLWETVETNQTNSLIRSAIRKLKPKMRLTIILYYYNDMTVKEIAQVMGCLQGTVKTRLHYAKKELEKTLGKQLEDNSSVRMYRKECIINDRTIG